MICVCYCVPLDSKSWPQPTLRVSWRAHLSLIYSGKVFLVEGFWLCVDRISRLLENSLWLVSWTDIILVHILRLYHILDWHLDSVWNLRWAYEAPCIVPHSSIHMKAISIIHAGHHSIAIAHWMVLIKHLIWSHANTTEASRASTSSL